MKAMCVRTLLLRLVKRAGNDGREQPAPRLRRRRRRAVVCVLFINITRCACCWLVALRMRASETF